MPILSASDLSAYLTSLFSAVLQKRQKAQAQNRRPLSFYEMECNFLFCAVTLLLTVGPVFANNNISDCRQSDALDLVFLIDGTLNQGPSSLAHIRHFLSHVANSLDTSTARSRMAIFTFDKKTKRVLDSAAEIDFGSFLSELQTLEITGKGTILLRRALRNAKRHIFSSNIEFRWRRERTKIIFVLVSKNSRDPAIEISTILRRIGVKIAVIGLEDASQAQLLPLVSKPSKKHLLMLNHVDKLPKNGSEFVAGIICEKLEETSSSGFDLKKTNTMEGNIQTQPFLNITSTTVNSNSIEFHISAGNPTPQHIDVIVLPDNVASKVTHRAGVVLVSGLEPALEYNITIVAVFTNSTKLVISQKLTTDQQKVDNLRTNIITARPCQMQENLMSIYGAKTGFVLSGKDCLPGNKHIMIDVEWQRTSTNAHFEVHISPFLPHLVQMPNNSTKRFFTNAQPGTKYQISVVTSSNNVSAESRTEIVIPPISPQNVGLRRMSSTEVVVATLTAGSAKFDTLVYDVVSPYKRYTVRDNSPSKQGNDSNTSMFTHTLDNLTPCSPHRISVRSSSYGVLSLPVSVRLQRCTEDTQSHDFDQSVVISTSNGIYAVPSKRTASAQVTPVMLVSVPSGVVNALLHRREINVKKSVGQGTNSYWAYSLIWIDRKTRSIRTTFVTDPTNSVTVVTGLLQPVGLAVDVYDNNVYWSDIASRSIGVARLPGPDNEGPSMGLNKRLITAKLFTPVGLAVDSVGRNLFWADMWGRVERSEMDGSNRKVLINDPIIRPQSLVFCMACDRLLWIDSPSMTINSIKSDGSDMRTMNKTSLSQSTFAPTLLTTVVSRMFVLNSNDNTMYEYETTPDGAFVPSSLPVSNFRALSSVTALTAQDLAAYEDALMESSEDLNFPCAGSDHNCEEVCISETLSKPTCAGQCYPWETLCVNSTHSCVSSILLCDGTEDCPNGEDEDPSVCLPSLIECDDPSMFLCKNELRCVANSSLCDGRVDCRDGSDEENCPIQHQTCEFEDDLCLWSQDSDDDFDWTLWHGRTPSDKTGPMFDHTMLRVNSSYIYAEATQWDEGAKARLISTWLLGPVCVEFSYHMFGKGIGSLSLFVERRNQDNSEKMWSASGNQGVFWKTSSVSISGHGLYQLVFQAVRGKDFSSDIALDDVIIRDGLCNVSYHCLFNRDDCGYENVNSVDGGWSIKSGSLPHFGEGSPEFVSETKHDLLDKNPVEELGSEWFYFPFKHDDTPGCSGCDGIKLVRQISSFGGPQFSGIVLCSPTRYKIYLSETLHGVFRNVADGFGLGEDHCEFIGVKDYAHEVGEYIHCQGLFGYRRIDFFEHVEKGIFGPHHNGGHPYFSPIFYDCNLTIPQTVIDFAPENRHHMEPERFAFFDGTSPGRMTSSFVVPVARKAEVSKTGGVVTLEKEPQFDRWCLSFSYHINGLTSKSFSLTVNGEFVIWQISDYASDSWNDGIASIPSSNVKYDLVFMAMKEEDEVGYIAVDNITINQLPCVRPQSYETGFDDSNLNANSFFVFGTVHHEMMQPLYERSRNDPIIVDSRFESSGVISYTAGHYSFPPFIESPILPAISSYYPVYCLSIEYRQRTHQGQLKVGVRRVQDFDSSSIITHTLTPVASVRPWLTLKIEVNSSISLPTENSFIIVFEGLGHVWLNSMAVDTLPCSQVERGSQCNNGVQCSNGRCVHPDQMCDGLNDCGDWSDEIGCPSHCGTIADVFNSRTTLLENKSNDHPVFGKQCFWRVHGRKGKQVLLDIGRSLRSRKEKFSLIVYKGFSGIADALIFSSESKLFQKDRFLKPSSYLIDENDVTIVLTFNRKIVLPVMELNVTIVEPTHCKFVCPDLTCLTDNYQCDGKVGCPDASDESNCTRATNLFGETLLEVRRLNDKFSLLCGDDVTHDVADAACQQLGFSKALQPLRFISLPKKHIGFSHYRLTGNLTDKYPQYIQSYITSLQGKREETYTIPTQGNAACSSGTVWVADCVPYQCGVRSIERVHTKKPMLKIVGGPTAPRGYWPWIASLRAGGENFCGGTLISDRHVITAAHCFDITHPREFTVTLGTNDLAPLDSGATTFTIVDFTIHDNYASDAEIPDWDIAMLVLDRKVKFTKFISPACLPGGNIRFRAGDMCYIAGYGYLEDEGAEPLELYQAQTPLLPREECNKYYNNKISSRMICAGYPKTGGMGICHGDSGGPLVCESDDGQWHLAGVVSWSIGCAKIERPDVFANVQYFIGWINQYADMNLTLPAHELPGVCGGTYYNLTEGAFASPGWPSFYPPEQFCLYRIIAAPGQTVRIEFDTFALEQDYDYVTIYKGGIETTNLFMRLTGNRSGGVFEISNATVELLFQSDINYSKAGFFTKWWISGDPLNFTGEAKPITILGSTTPYQESSDLLLIVGDYVSSGVNAYRPTYEQVVLSIDTLVPTYKMFFYEPLGQWRIMPQDIEDDEVPQGTWLYCNDSAILPSDTKVPWSIWNGTDWTEIDLQMEIFSEPSPTTVPQTPTTIISSTGIRRPVTDSSDVTCPTTYRHDAAGLIESPGFPIEFPVQLNLTCQWRMRPSSNGSSEARLILLLVQYYDLDERMEIFSGDYVTGSQPLAFIEPKSAIDETFILNRQENLFAGSGNGPVQTPSAHPNTASTVSLLSQSDINRIAGQIAAQPQCLHSFTRFSASNACSSDLYTMFNNNGDEGVTSLLNCSLFIKCWNASWCDLVPVLEDLPYYVTLAEATENYCKDPTWKPPTPNTTFYPPGGLIHDVGLGNSTRPRRQLFIYTDTSHSGLTLKLKSLGTSTGHGFSIKYHTVSDINQSPYNHQEYNVQHIGDTLHHRTIRSIHSALGLSFGHPTNSPPSIFVTRTPGTNPDRHTTQANIGETSTPSVAPLVHVELTANITCVGTSWKSGDQWFITSPNFPREYNPNSNCMWRFKTTPGYQIVLKFSKMFVEGDLSCSYDSVSLYDGPDRSSQRIGKFCDNRNSFIRPQLSNGPEMFIHFRSDHYVHMQGFKASLSTRETPTRANKTTNQTVLYSCHFDDDMCGFDDELVSSDFTWTRNRLTTSSDKTGPPYDDSPMRNGWYAYIEASSPQRKGDRARIISPLIRGSPDEARCLRFSYDMYGGALGFLNVFAVVGLRRNHTRVLLEEDGSESVSSTEPLVYLYGSGVQAEKADETNTSVTFQRFLLWSRSGQQRRVDEKPWMQASITFYPSSDFQVMFEGVRGRTYESDTAIDNMEVLEGKCQDECKEDGQLQCLTSSGLISTVPASGVCVMKHVDYRKKCECVSIMLKCDGVKDCASGSDELYCITTLRQMCAAETTQPNTTLALVCDDEHVDQCGLRSSSITRIDQIICDGKNDCFGGYDEALCPEKQPNSEPEPVLNALHGDCGIQDGDGDQVSTYPNVPNSDLWRWVVGLYVAKPSLVKSNGHTTSTGVVSSAYTFLCSAVFIQDNWAVVPAHCILNPDMYDNYARSLLDADKTGPDGELLAEFDDPDLDAEVPATFSYILIRSRNSGDEATAQRVTWKVTNWFLHPDYVVRPNSSSSSEDGEAPSTYFDRFKTLSEDSDSANSDVALLKVELDDEVLSQVDVNSNTGDVVEEEEMFYVTYDVGMNVTEDAPPKSACLEMKMNKIRKRGSSGGFSAFPLPVELERHPLSSSEPESTKPRRANCIAIGHSPINSGSEEEHLVWSLRQSRISVTSSELSAPHLFCDSYQLPEMRKLCLETIASDLDSPSAVGAMRLNTTIRGGHGSVRTSAYLNDPGLSLFCKRHDDRWFLTGLYSWLNFKRNFITPNYTSILSNMHIWPNDDPTLGIPLGTDYFLKVTQRHNEWIDKLLSDACPGQFSCYPAHSSHPVKCIPHESICDGKVDCPMNNADEHNCTSGCSYDPVHDPFHRYYSRLGTYGVELPEKTGIVDLEEYDNARRSWRNESVFGVQRIRFNMVDSPRPASCRWVIQPPAGKITVLRIPKMSVSPVLGGGNIQIINQNERFIHDFKQESAVYMSLPGKPIAFSLTPPPGSKQLTALRSRYFEYFFDDVGLCTGMHKCFDGKCVSLHKLCDGELDCTDMSDERECPSGCGGPILLANIIRGSILSRNYPLPHYGSGDCTWMIVGQQQQTDIITEGSTEYSVSIEFSEFKTSHDNDVMYVYEGVGKDRTLQDTYYGQRGAFNVNIQSDRATIVLRSNDDIAMRRINATFYMNAMDSTV